MRTALVAGQTPETLDELRRWACDTVRRLDAAPGMVDWRERRDRYERSMMDDFSWRARKRPDYAKTDAEDTIYNRQNDSLNIVGSFGEFMSARTIEDIFGTVPFYTLLREGRADREKAEVAFKWTDWKLSKSNFREALVDAIPLAYAIGEGIVKVRWRTDVETSEELVQEPSVDPVTGEPLVAEDGTPVTEERLAEKVTVRYRNVDGGIVHHNDIVAELNVPTLDDSDLVGHIYDLPLGEIIDLFAPDPDVIDQLRSENPQRKTRSATEEDGGGENADATKDADQEPRVKVAECYIPRWRIPGTDRVIRVLAIVAIERDILLWADYMSNVFPNGKMPFFVVRGWKAGKRRWYGRGLFEAFQNAQNSIDTKLNQIEYRNRFHSNPPTFFQPDALENYEDEGDLKLEPGKLYELRAGKKPSDAYGQAEFADLDDRTWDLLQLQMQFLQMRSGVSGAAQGDANSLPQNNTATGIEAILASGNTLSRRPVLLMKDGIEAALWFAILLEIEHMDDEETFLYTEGEGHDLLTMMKQDLDGIEIDVRLLLTRFRRRMMKENATGAINAVIQYMQIPEPEKEFVRPLFVQVLKGWEIDDAEEIVRQPMLMPPAPAPGEQPAEDSGAVEPQSPSEEVEL